jgi:tetratricopeptide (TPR) repeat protein
MVSLRRFLCVTTPLLFALSPGCKDDATKSNSSDKTPTAKSAPIPDPSTVPQEKRDQAAKLVLEARALRDKADYLGAKRKDQEAARIDPSNIKARLGTELVNVSPENARAAAEALKLAYTLRQKGDIMGCYRNCVKARTLDPNNDDALEKSAVSAGFVRRFDEARETYQEIARRNPSMLKPLVQIAETAYAQGDYAGCIEFLKRAEPLLDQDPKMRDNAELWMMLGIASRRRSLAPDAISAFQRAVRLAPSEARYHEELAETLLQEGQFDLAVRSFQDAIKIKPNNGETHYRLGLAYQRKGDLEKAAEALKQSIRYDSTNFSAYVTCARVYEAMGGAENLLKATSYLEQALHLNPLSHEALHTFAAVARKQGDAATADDYSERYNAVFTVSDRQTETLRSISRRLRENPQDVKNHLARIELQVSFKHWLEAEEYCQELLLMDPHSIDAIEHMARLAFVKRDIEAVYYESEKIKDYAPGDHRGFMLAASYWYTKNDLGAALQNAERAHQIAPNEYGPVELLVQLYQRNPEMKAKLDAIMPLANELYEKVWRAAEEEKKKNQELLDIATGKKKAS